MAAGIGVLLEITGVLSHAVAILGITLLAASYAAAIVHCCHRRQDSLVLRALTALGRLALTNYILQSILYGLIFYSTGLGLHGRLTAAQVVVLTPMVLVMQVMLSLGWLRHFQMGPLEWLWRTISYGYPVRMRRVGAASTCT